MRALVVDDSKITRGLLAQILQGSGYDAVEQAPDGAAALDLLGRTAFDLVVTDWRMPRLDGLGLLRAARSDPRLAEIPFVVISSVSEDDLVAAAFQAGARNFIRKPFDPAAVRKVLSEVANVERLRHGARVVPAITGTLASVGVVELVQFVQLTSRSGTLTLTLDPPHSGEVDFDRGQIVAARLGSLSGEDAFFALVPERKGSFRFEPGTSPGPRTVQRSTMALLLDALRASDERARVANGSAR